MKQVKRPMSQSYIVGLMLAFAGGYLDVYTLSLIHISSNHYGATADGLIMGYRAGASLLYQDSIQYHPTERTFSVTRAPRICVG